MNTTNFVPSVAAMGKRAGEIAAEHLDHAFRAILRGDSVTAEPRFVRLITGTPHPFGNFAVLTRADDPAGAKAAAQGLVACGAPAAVLTCSKPSAAVASELKAFGFEMHPGLPAMAVEIERLAATPLPAGCTLAPVGPERRQEWGEAFAVGYELPLPVGDQIAAGIGEPNLQYYAIIREGKMVCTSMVFFHGGLAGIYAVATLPEARRLGLGACATAEPLRQAKALGYRVGVLQSSEAGHSVYRKIGFADYGEVVLFVK